MNSAVVMVDAGVVTGERGQGRRASRRRERVVQGRGKMNRSDIIMMWVERMVRGGFQSGQERVKEIEEERHDGQYVLVVEVCGEEFNCLFQNRNFIYECGE